MHEKYVYVQCMPASVQCHVPRASMCITSAQNPSSCGCVAGSVHTLSANKYGGAGVIRASLMCNCSKIRVPRRALRFWSSCGKRVTSHSCRCPEHPSDWSYATGFSEIYSIGQGLIPFGALRLDTRPCFQSSSGPVAIV